jgi:dimethylamine/trimethylamine dehydrogenase
MSRRDPRHDILFEPVTIGPHTLRNRFYQVPHCTGFGVAKPWTQAAFRGMKAEGGWAAVCSEYCSISPETDDTPYNHARLWDDHDAHSLALMVHAAHEHGALAGVELWHGGALAEQHESRAVLLSPSARSEGVAAARAMTISDIRRTQDDWVRAADRAAAIGFDIVYVYGAHSYLPTQFLSPLTNQRADAYGGSFENRARFWIETIELVRDAVADRCAIAVRIAADSLDTAGVEPQDGLAFIRAADHLVDLWDVSIGSVAGPGRIDSGASRFAAPGYQLDLEWPRRAREATAKPIVGVGRLTNPDQMAQIIRSGVWDLIGAARPSIADPFLPRKIEQGAYDEIRECIGCNACYARAIYGNHLGCTQNATAGEEYRRGWHPERFASVADPSRDALVIGAGPAGMETAIVLAKRGVRRVHLVDANDDIGGCMRWIPRLPGLGDWARVVDWRRIQLRKLRRHIDVITGVELSADQARDYGSDVVICTTGAAWDTGLPGGEHALTPELIMLHARRPAGRHVTIVDHEGYFVAVGLAELLASEGHQVTLQTPFDVAAPHLEKTLEAHGVRRTLHRLGVVIRTQMHTERVTPDATHGHDQWGEPFTAEADSVVLVYERRACDSLYHDLVRDPAALAGAAISGVYRAGDCVAPRLIADAIFDGHRLAREIDAADPALPTAYLRERPLVSQ